MNKAFARSEAKNETVLKLRVQVSHQTEAILAAAAENTSSVVLAGKTGNSWSLDIGSGRISPQYRLNAGPVFSLAHLNDGTPVIGTEDGVSTDKYAPPFRERVVAIAIAPWGAKGSVGAIITGSREGFVRRLTLAGGLTQFSEEAYEKVGRRVNCLAADQFEVIAGSGSDLVILDQQMRTQRTIRVPFDVSGAVVVKKNTVVVCGEGNIAHVNLESGAYSRIITASNDATYCCVASLDYDETTFCFGTTSGRVGIMALDSGVELGAVDVGFEIRGVLPVGKKLLAYGGDWKLRGRSVALVSIETMTQPVTLKAAGRQ